MDAFEDAGGSIRNFRKLSARMCLGSALRPAPVWAILCISLPSVRLLLMTLMNPPESTAYDIESLLPEL